MRSDHHAIPGDEPGAAPGEALFHEEDDARDVAEQLRAAGFEAEVARARFAGEDDDEDQPWRLRTTADRGLLAAYAGPREGWLEPVVTEVPTAAQPMRLPTAPRRAHRDRDARGPRDGGPLAPPT